MSLGEPDLARVRHLKRAQYVFCSFAHQPFGGQQRALTGTIAVLGIASSAAAVLALSAIPQVVANATSYIKLLRSHIQRENNVLFPMADRVLPAPIQAAIWDKFEHVEHEQIGDGARAKYEALPRSWSRKPPPCRPRKHL